MIFFSKQSADLSVFETNIRYVGGLLSCYAFTGDPMFKEKAQYVAEKLLPAFQTPTGIPNALVNLKTGVSCIETGMGCECRLIFILFNRQVKIMDGIAEVAAYCPSLELFIWNSHT